MYVVEDMLVCLVSFCLISSLCFSSSWARCIFKILKESICSCRSPASSNVQDWRWRQINLVSSLSLQTVLSCLFSWILVCTCSPPPHTHLFFPISLLTSSPTPDEKATVICKLFYQPHTCQCPSNKPLILSHSWWFCFSDQILSYAEYIPGPVRCILLYVVQLKPHKASFLN